MQKEIYVLINECLGEGAGRAVCFCVGSSEQHEAGQCGGEERRRNVCGPVADSYIRLALEYSARPSCSPPLSFLHTPALNILLWKNPLRRYRPSPTPHAKNIQPRPPLHPPAPELDAHATMTAAPLHCLCLEFNTSSLSCRLVYNMV